MNYSFKYKPKHIDRTFSQRKNKFLSDLVFSLYRSKLYQFLRLDRDSQIRSHCDKSNDQNSFGHDIKNETKFSGLAVEKILFYDIIRIEDAEKYKKQIMRVASKLKPALFQEDHRRSIGNSFDDIDNHYSMISFGTMFRGVVQDESETDLIKYIKIGYVKGKESSIIVTYTVYPSDKFNSLLTKCLESDSTTEYEVMDVSFKHFFGRSNGYSRFGFGTGMNMKFLNSKYWTDKLFDEINYHLKSKILKGVGTGVFTEHRKLLFPRIVTFEYEKAEFSNYEEELYRVISSDFRGGYSSNDDRFTLEYCDFKTRPSQGVNILLAKRHADEIQHGLNTVDYVSDRYSDQILPKLMLTNIANLQQERIVSFRKKIFRHLKKNRVSLFLTKTLRLKNRLTLSVIDFERFAKDLVGDDRMHKGIFDEELVLPEALRKCHNVNCQKKHDFNAELTSDCKSAEEDIRSSFKELSTLFQTISEDNQSRANMRLQRLLFWLAILGALLTLYGTNAAWCNSWVEYFLNKIGGSVPRV